jgi:hypothetical protein
MTPGNTRIRGYHFILLFLIGVLAHGLVLTNDGSYVDGWHFNYFIENSQWEKMKRFWYEQGRPPYYWWSYIPFNSFYNIYLVKFIPFVCILVASFLQYTILARFTPLLKSQAFFVAALALAWPFYHLIAWNMYPDQIQLIMFYGAWLIFLNQREKGSLGISHIIVFLMLFHSFLYQGFLVYHYAILLVFFLYTLNYPKKLHWLNIKPHILPFLKENWLISIVPLFFFFLQPWVFPVYGAYEQYYSISMFSIKTLAFIVGGLLNTLFGPVVAVFFYYPLLPVLILAIAGAWFWSKKKGQGEIDGEEPAAPRGLMVVGFLLILSIVFAHAANEKMAVLLTYQGRHSRFAGLGFGLLTLGCLQYLREKFSWFKRTHLKFSMVLVLICLIYVDVNIYMTYQARWARTQAVVHQLKKIEPIENVNIYFMRNQMTMGMGVDYHYADVSLVLNQAWGGEKYLGVPPYLQRNRFDRELISIIINTLKGGSNPFPAAREYLKTKHPDIEVAQQIVKDWIKGGLRTGVENFRPGGCMGEIIVIPKKSMHDFSLAIRYLFRRTFHPSTLQQLYDDIAKVRIRPLNINLDNRPCPETS